jgi:hypothetical protein
LNVPANWRVHTAEALCVIGGGALLASAFTHWVRRGPGSSLRGHELVDTIVSLGRSVPGMSSARLTVLWYLVPALGALAWIVVGLRGASSRWTLGVAIAAATVSVMTSLAFARLTGLSDLGIGPALAVGGACMLLAGALLSVSTPH